MTNVPDPPRVLLVEDDADMRELLDDALKAAGFDVHATGSVPEAKRVLAEAAPAHAVDLLLTDVSLTRGSGEELIVAARASSRPPAVLMMTAFPDDALRARATALAVPLLEKPFSLQEVTDAARNAIARDRP